MTKHSKPPALLPAFLEHCRANREPGCLDWREVEAKYYELYDDYHNAEIAFYAALALVQKESQQQKEQAA